MIVVIMGVCGCGKTSVGQALANRLGWQFFDADDFHPPANVAKMATGVALTDEDREPWLDRLATEMRAVDQQRRHAVLACSALKESYRQRIARGLQEPGPEGDGGAEFRIVYLKGDAKTIEPRLALRSGHFMPSSLLASQFAALEEPDDAMVIDIRQTTEAQAAQIAAALQSTV
ncbi:MAG: gluconokinase [Betaproteobacteria bacterium]|nr:MAG: gluconokinase [Betaproteobacteria bacterium]